mmetsp:Transcript_47917/g.112943  ORF Transcript_47917/g.112943 Transcript_47917/m.112943 type:complete len:235 (+) Transcript_47917:422-1126(+)
MQPRHDPDGRGERGDLVVAGVEHGEFDQCREDGREEAQAVCLDIQLPQVGEQLQLRKHDSQLVPVEVEVLKSDHPRDTRRYPCQPVPRHREALKVGEASRRRGEVVKLVVVQLQNLKRDERGNGVHEELHAVAHQLQHRQRCDQAHLNRQKLVRSSTEIQPVGGNDNMLRVGLAAGVGQRSKKLEEDSHVWVLRQILKRKLDNVVLEVQVGKVCEMVHFEGNGLEAVVAQIQHR